MILAVTWEASVYGKHITLHSRASVHSARDSGENVRVNTRAKGNPIKAVREGLKDLQAERLPNVTERSGVSGVVVSI